MGSGNPGVTKPPSGDSGDHHDHDTDTDSHMTLDELSLQSSTIPADVIATTTAVAVKNWKESLEETDHFIVEMKKGAAIAAAATKKTKSFISDTATKEEANQLRGTVASAK